MFGSVLLDPRSGRVVESGRGLASVRLVNPSLECCISCVRGFIGCFLFCSGDSGSDEWEGAAQKVEELVCRQTSRRASTRQTGPAMGEHMPTSALSGGFAARLFGGSLMAAKPGVSRWKRPYAGHVPSVEGHTEAVGRTRR